MNGRFIPWLAAGGIGIVVAALMPSPLPLVGATPAELDGGVRVDVRVDGSGDPELARRYLELRLSEYPARVERTKDGFSIDVGKASVDEAKALSESAKSAGFAIHPVLSHPYHRRLYEFVRSPVGEIAAAENGVTGGIDTWSHYGSGRQYREPYLSAASRDALSAFVGIAREQGIESPPEAELAFEEIRPELVEGTESVVWRTYLLDATPVLSQVDLRRAYVGYNPQTNRPEVIVEFHRDGAERFGEFTGEHVGERLAIVINGRVTSAPSIHSAITGGRVVVTLGGASPREMQREAEELVSNLQGPAPPVPVTYGDIEVVEKRLALELLLRAAFALLAAFLVLLVMGRSQPAPALVTVSERRLRAWPALLWTLVAPVVLVLGSGVVLPRVNEDELLNLLASAGDAYYTIDSAAVLAPFSVFALVLTPLLTALVLVEIGALFRRTWRLRRLGDPGQRKPLRIAAFVLALVLAAAQAYFMSRWLESIGGGGVGIFGVRIVKDVGFLFRITTIATLVAGVGVLGVLAGLLESRALVGGVAVVVIVGPMGFHGETMLVALAHPDLLASLWSDWWPLLAVAALTWWFTGRRVGRLRLPSCGIIPLEWAAVTAMIVMALHMSDAVWATRFFELTGGLTTSWKLLGTIALVLCPLFTFLFARSQRFSAREVLPSAVASLIYLEVLIYAFTAGGSDFPGVVSACFVGAFARDAWTEWRARRSRDDWTAVWVGHEVHRASQAVADYTEAGIDVFARGIHLRSVLHFFGPFFPVTVMVPREQAGQLALSLQSGDPV